MTSPRIAFALDVTIGFALVAFLAACGATLLSAQDSQRIADDVAAQVACVDESGTRAEAVACQCAVRARYEGPQCEAGQLDGGAR